MGVNISGTVFIFLFASMVAMTEQARIKRCFVCRSRGDLGDCKDPFMYNATTAELSRAVEAQPCAAGWCAKVIEGKGDDYAIATERMCLQRPPGDEEQRCSPTLYLNRKVMMCFCKGDLCNAASKPSIYSVGLIVCLLGYLFGKFWL